MYEFAIVIEEILDAYDSKWPENITDLVFVAIEENPDYLKKYEEFANGKYSTANQRIGKYVKKYTGLKAGEQCRHPRSRLIKSYTLLE